MTRRRRLTLALSITLLSLLLFAVLGSWWALHTSWFMNLVRQRLVASVERATGGHVEIGSFTYDSSSLTAQAKDFILHGTEPAGSPPLLRADSIRVGLKILSLARRDIDIASLQIDHPEINLLVAPDGSTNIPSPRVHRVGNPIQQLLDLKVKHFEVRNGVLHVRDRKIPLNIDSQGLVLLLSYNVTGPSYNIALSLPDVNLQFRHMPTKPISLDSVAHLFKDHLAFERLDLKEGQSNIHAAGNLERFARPRVHLAVNAALGIDDLVALADLHDLREGRAELNGELDYDDDTSRFLFSGKAKARGVNYLSQPFKLRNISASSDLTADNDGMHLGHIVATARGARATGEGSIKNYRQLQIEATLTQLALTEVGTYLTDQPFPWSGTVGGPVRASALLTKNQPNFVLSANVQIDPAPGGVPVSGVVDVVYYDSPGVLQFNNALINLPNSQVAVSGQLAGDLLLKADSNNLSDLAPLLPLISARIRPRDLPVLTDKGHAHFEGLLRNVERDTQIQGSVTLSKFLLNGHAWDNLQGDFSAGAQSLTVPSFHFSQAGASAAGSASLTLADWSVRDDSPFHLKVQVRFLDVVKTAALFTSARVPFIKGIASGTADLTGTLAKPVGKAQIHIDNLDAYGEQFNQIQFDVHFNGNLLEVSHGRIDAGPASLMFSADYRHSNAGWTTGDISFKADTNGFPLASLSAVRKFVPALNAEAELHLEAAARIGATRAGTTNAGTVNVEPLRTNGSLLFRSVSLNKVPYGSALIKASTKGQTLGLTYSGDLRGIKWEGTAQAALTPGTPIKGDLHMDRLSFATLKSLLSNTTVPLPVDGFLQGGLTFDGPLEIPDRMHASLRLDRLELSSPLATDSLGRSVGSDLILRNAEPIVIDATAGVATVQNFSIAGKDTSLNVAGSIPYLGGKPLDVKVSGAANLKIFELLDANVSSSGTSVLSASITGTLAHPLATGTLEIKNGSFFLENFPNGLSAVSGTVVFNRDRATIQNMTAHSGGGELSLGGFVNFGGGGPLVYHLEASAQNVRVRYAGTISVTASSNLRLSGTSTSSILSGTLTVSRVVFTPNTDVGNLLASVGAPAAAGSENDFFTGLHLDIAVESAPNLQVSTSLSRDVEAEIELRLRGTPEHPILLGSIAANQGDIKVFGTRYSINRGEVSFVNTVRIEPVLDLDLETQTRGVTVDITISGAPSKLNINYRSDPPLQPRDIIALLTVGRAPDAAANGNVQAVGDVSALKSGANSVLGQAISPVSNRLSKLFGITSIKIDPLVQAITNTPQARLTVEQQISRDITITYVTNLSQTSEQIFRLEWAFTRQFSIVALRDDNGEFGIDFQYKKRFR